MDKPKKSSTIIPLHLQIKVLSFNIIRIVEETMAIDIQIPQTSSSQKQVQIVFNNQPKFWD